MPLIKLAADTFGVVTISLVSLFAILGLVCIYRSIHFWLRIQREDFHQLCYFNGPWITRIALILVAIWSGVGEIVRLSLLRGEDRLFSSLIWQRNVCKFYIVSNLGFAEPGLLLTLVFLLRASLQKRESGTLSQRWNRRTIGYVLLFSLPILVMQVALVVLGPKLNEQESNGRTKMSKYFTSTSSIKGSSSICTYPLFGTIFLGLFYALLVSYVVYIGTHILSLVINKGLRRRVYWLTSSVIFFLPLRVLLLGFTVLPLPGDLAYECIVFSAFVMLLCCATVGICMLVYCPAADSLALRDVSPHIEMGGLPYDDYCFEGASLMGNGSHLDMGRSSDVSTKRGSISFRTMIREEPPALDGLEEAGFSSFDTLLTTHDSTGRSSQILRR